MSCGFTKSFYFDDAIIKIYRITAKYFFLQMLNYCKKNTAIVNLLKLTKKI